MQWTDAQQAAIEARGSNLLVSAAAGSGKTAVLTWRIVSLVREGASIDAMLVVTFTRAAAAEMRARILSALQDAASLGDARLAAQALRVEQAHISTLHAFCSDVCRTHFQAAGVDPTFRVADQAEADVLREEAMKDALTACYEAMAKSPGFAHLASLFSAQEIARQVKTLHTFLMARPDPMEWLDAAVLSHDVSAIVLSTSDWLRVLLARVKMAADEARRAYATLIAFTMDLGRHEAFAREEAVQAEAFYDAVCRGHQDAIAFPPCTFKRRPSSKDVDEETALRFARLRDAAKKALTDAQKALGDVRRLEDRAEDETETLPALSGLADAVKAFDVRYRALKAEKNLLDFQDQEHYALRALRDEAVAASVRRQYAHVFVDEYQDSSALQEAIVRRAARGDNLFMVGDVKQSIYRFRLAEPTLFLSKMQTYSFDEGTLNRKIALNANFRTRPKVLDGINDVFSHVFCGAEMELDYPPEERLIAGRESGEKDVYPVLHRIAAEAEDDEEMADAPTAAELTPGARNEMRLEAAWIAEQIGRLLAEGYALRDIAILMRTVSGKAAQLVEALRGHGIAAWSDIGENALDRGEVQELVSLLAIMDNLHQDIPLAAALRGPALGLDDDALAQIRAAHPDGALADAVLARAEADDALAGALRSFVERVRGWALDAQVLPLDALIRRIFEETGQYAQCGAKPDGALRQANLRMLAERAGAFERAQFGGLAGFLRYLEQMRAHEGLAARTLSASDDVVRVLSIHKSKGLQFPVVFIAGLGRRFRKGEPGPLQLHAELGIGMEYREARLRVKRQTVSTQAIAEQRRREALAEEARILYVAMTRAEERLLMVGTPRKGDAERWRSAPPPQMARSMMDWLVPVAEASACWISTEGISSPAQTIPAPKDRLLQVARAVRETPPQSGPVEAALAYEPPQAQRLRPIKQSVSAVVRAIVKRGEESQALPLEDAPRRPLFMERRGLNAAERGSALHAFLSAVPLDAVDIDAERRAMVANGLLTPEQDATLQTENIRRMMGSALWQRMRAAQILHREWPFNLRIETDGERTLLQGIIDCCFVEEDAWVLVDYKSDRAIDDVQARARYGPQIALYANALAEMTARPVKERILFMTTSGKALTVEEAP